jgi:hypothetical protein
MSPSLYNTQSNLLYNQTPHGITNAWNQQHNHAHTSSTTIDLFMKEFWYQVFHIFYHVSIMTSSHHDCLVLVEGKKLLTFQLNFSILCTFAA